MLHQLSDDKLEAIRPDQGWFIFAVVRHPSSRLWSAWQSKLLLREPRWPERFAGEAWLPRVPYSTADVVEDFQKFVLALPSDPDELPLRDRHFQIQSRLLAPERIPYTRVYRTGELSELLDDLQVHLAAQGWEGQLDLTDRNETPLRPLESMFTPEIQDKIRSVYGRDFETFGYDGILPNNLHPEDEYEPAELDEVRRLIDRAERMGDLAVWAAQLGEAAEARRQELEELRPEVAGLREDIQKVLRDVERLRAAADNRPLVKVKRRVRRLARSLKRLRLDPGRDRDGTKLVSTTKTAGR
jgi:Sulfotransferase family